MNEDAGEIQLFPMLSEFPYFEGKAFFRRKLLNWL